MKGEVLNPVFGKAEANFARASGKPTNREDHQNMTRRVERPGPVTPYTIAMDIARQMPMVFLVGFIAYKLDQRNEENARARLTEAQDNTRTILAVVQANTAVMQKVADRLPDIERALQK